MSPNRFKSLLSPAMILRWCLASSVFAAHATVAAEPASEDVVKAAVIFKLTRFVEWPARSFDGKDNALRICALGDSPVADALQVVAGRVAQGRPIEYAKLSTVSTDDNCHLVFAGDDRSSRLLRDTVIDSLLTVSDTDGFAKNGGIIELTRRGARLGFRIHVGNARRAGLVISAPLLELAEIIE